MRGVGILAVDTIHHAMNDLIYLGITAVFFMICGLYARGCETL